MRSFIALVAAVIFCFLVTTPTYAQLASRSMDIGIGAGYTFGGTVDVDGADVDMEGNALIHAFADFYLVEKFAWGVYATFGPGVKSDLSDETATMYEFGMSLKPRFILSDGDLALRPALQIGYRIIDIDSDVEGIDVDGMAVNASVEVQFKTSSHLVPFGQVGFITQPTGGNDFSDVTWGPMFYLMAGVAF